MRSSTSLAFLFGVGLTAAVVVGGCRGPAAVTPYGNAPLPASAVARSKVAPYVIVSYALPADTYKAVAIPVKVVALPSAHALYDWGLYVQYANGAQGEIRFSTVANYVNGRGAEFYIFQAGGSAKTQCPSVGHGRGIIPGCCPSVLYGGDVACVAGYPWLTGSVYTLSVSLQAKNASHETWNAYLNGDHKHAAILIGTWDVPRSWGLLQFTTKAQLSFQVGSWTLPRCGVEPYSDTLVLAPVATTQHGSKVTAKISASYVSGCTSNAVVKAKPGEGQANVQMGYAWRPGATPSPSPSPPVGTPLFTPLPMPTGTPMHLSQPVNIGRLQVVIPPNEYGFVNFPDEQVSTLQFSNKSYRMWLDSGAPSYGESGTFLLTSSDLNTFAPIPAALPYAVSIYDTWDPGTERFDANYGAPGTVTPASNGRDLLMIYHGENHFYSGRDYTSGAPGGYFYCTAGLARSSDDGETWARVGAIITGAFRKPLKPATGGACNPSVIAVGGYLYAVYMEAAPRYVDLALARSALSSDGAPGSWEKYYKGSFSSDALHNGKFTALNTSGAGGEPNVTFNDYLNSFVLLLPYPAGSNGIAMLTSSDLITWSQPRTIIALPSGACQPVQLACYPSMVSDSTTASQVSHQSGYIYVSHAVKGMREMDRYPYTIGGKPANEGRNP